MKGFIVVKIEAVHMELLEAAVKLEILFQVCAHLGHELICLGLRVAIIANVDVFESRVLANDCLYLLVGERVFFVP